MSGTRVSIPLLVGEVFVDCTLTERGQENKLRLGGIAHAARAFWALGVPFSVAAILPAYLDRLAASYLETLGCVEFYILAIVDGAPNVTVIVDPTEVADQEYETLLRDEKSVIPTSVDLSDRNYNDALIFPGSYDMPSI